MFDMLVTCFLGLLLQRWLNMIDITREHLPRAKSASFYSQLLTVVTRGWLRSELCCISTQNSK